MSDSRTTSGRKAKVRLITKHPSEVVLDHGLPRNVDGERFVLGAMLRNAEAVGAADSLVADDFSLEKHRRIFTAILAVREGGECIDYVTVANELATRGELESCDGVSYLVDLTSGIPDHLHVESWARILREKRIQRRTIFSCNKAMNEALLEIAKPTEILADHAARIEELRTDTSTDGTKIQRIEDLKSIFLDQEPIHYLIEPELPEKAVVYLAGESGCGKSTLACAWARDLVAMGHAALLLDRDKNARKIVRDRFKRLGQNHHPLLYIWDIEQLQDAPQPDDPRVLGWIKRMRQDTGREPLIIVDSLVAFLREGESENDSTAMRAVFDRCKKATALGATVVLLHHVGHSGQPRGSSDFKPASDQGFLVLNHGGPPLSKIELKVDKPRYGITDSIWYSYADGRMLREKDRVAISKTVSEQLNSLLRLHPGATKKAFEELAVKTNLGRDRSRQFLDLGVQSGDIRLEPNKRGPGGRYYLTCDAPEDGQEGLKMDAPDEVI